MAAALRWAAGWLAVALVPVLAGLYVAATTFPGGTAVPWRPVMVDLEVYRMAGDALLDGRDFYALPGQLPFLYPPFAALLAVPLAVLPAAVGQIGWTALGVLALLAIGRRFGLTGWLLSAVATAAVIFVGPVRETLAFGQLGIVLVALVVVDLLPAPGGEPRTRLLPTGLLPTGVLTALAAAVKLTPAIFVVFLLASRRWRATAVGLVTGAVVTLLTAIVVPGPSLDFWGRLARGDTGLGHSLIYYTNQSVMADVVRIGGLGAGVAAAGLALSAAVAVLGVWAGVRWHARGEPALAVVIVGVASLLASPVSWWHHFVWVVPLALVLIPALRRRTGSVPAGSAKSGLPLAVTVLGWALVIWTVWAPFRRLPNGADVELAWTAGQHALASVTAVIGTAWLLAALITARTTR